MLQKIKRFILPMLAVAATAAYPAIFLYCRNADEANFSEILPALLICLGAGFVLFAICFAFTRSAEKASISASLLLLVLLNFSFLEKGLKAILPTLKYWHTLPIILAVALHIIYFLCRFLGKDAAKDVSRVLCLVFGGLVLFNVATASPQILNRIRVQRQLQGNPDPAVVQQGEATEDMPNVYLLIFDEYANFPQMEEYYDYDNAPLKEFLEENQFNISYTSHNETIMSVTVQTNMINYDYIVDDADSASEKDVLRKNGALFNLMREHGYDIRILERDNFYGGSLPSGEVSQQAGARTLNGEGLGEVFAQQTALYPFAALSAQRSKVMRVAQYWEIANYISRPSETMSNTFTLAYFCFPHQPFDVDENGKEISLPVDPMSPEAWNDKKYYLGQFKHATKMMITMCEGIVESDPDAVIMLMSDHGARGLGLGKDPLFPWDVMTNSLNALYYQGKTIEIEGLSNVNTIRTVLNNLFDLNLEMVEIPEGEYRVVFLEDDL